MSRPVYEPSLPRTDSELAYGTRQLYRRPSPGSGEINSVAWLDHGFVGSIPSGVWTSVTVEDPYDEGAITDPDEASYTLDLTSGCIEWDNPGEYWVTAWLKFDDAVTNGTLLGAALTVGNNCNFASDRVGNIIVADANTNDLKIPVTMPIWDPVGVTGPNSVMLSAYHNEGSDLQVSNAVLHVMRVTGGPATFFT